MTPEAKQQSQTIIDGAIKTLTEIGWIQGNAYALNEDGKVTGACMLGAISCRNSAYRRVLHTGVTEILANLIRSDADKFTERWVIADWNDAPGRTRAEVIDLLRRARMVIGDL